MRNLALIFLIVFGFWGCDGTPKNSPKSDGIEIPPPDVPIAKSDGNASIDSDFPPIPVAE